MKEVEVEILKSRLAQLLYDYDTYEAKDCFDSEEDAYKQIEEMLSVQTGIEVLIDFCEGVLDSDDEALYSEAEELKKQLELLLL